MKANTPGCDSNYFLPFIFGEATPSRVDGVCGSAYALASQSESKNQHDIVGADDQNDLHIIGTQFLHMELCMSLRMLVDLLKT